MPEGISREISDMNRWLKLILVVLVMVAAYAAFTCVIRVEEGNFAVARDVVRGDTLIFSPGWHFIWQGAVPDRVSVTFFKKRNTARFDIRIPLPPLEELKSDTYTGRVPVSLVYDIDPSKVVLGADDFGTDGRVNAGVMMKALEGFFLREMRPWLVPVYNRYGVYNNEMGILRGVDASLRSYAAKIGIDIVQFELTGAIALPDEPTYAGGVRFLNDLRELEKTNRKEIISLNAALEREKQRNKSYLDRLSDISRLLKNNPDILKFIYIDKMADDVKVIISSDKTGIPFNLDIDGKPKIAEKKGVVDNLKK